MKPLDEELKSALRPVEPPDGFAEKVVARARMGKKSELTFGQSFRAGLRPDALRWGAAFCLACLILVFGVIRYRRVQETRVEAQIAGAQAKLALQIASAKLNAALKDAAHPSRHNLEN